MIQVYLHKIIFLLLWTVIKFVQIFITIRHKKNLRKIGKCISKDADRVECNKRDLLNLGKFHTVRERKRVFCTLQFAINETSKGYPR